MGSCCAARIRSLDEPLKDCAHESHRPSRRKLPKFFSAPQARQLLAGLAAGAGHGLADAVDPGLVEGVRRVVDGEVQLHFNRVVARKPQAGTAR